MKITYHAWIAEQIGIEEEKINFSEVKSLSELIKTLQNHNSIKESIFDNLEKVYIAVNNILIKKSNIDIIKISDNDTVSFFPAISGG